MVHRHKPKCLVNRLDCCTVQDQDHSKNSKHCMFVSRIFSVPFSLCNESRCVDVLLLIARPSETKWYILTTPWLTLQYLSLGTQRRLFCHARQQTFKCLELEHILCTWKVLLSFSFLNSFIYSVFFTTDFNVQGLCVQLLLLLDSEFALLWERAICIVIWYWPVVLLSLTFV